MRLCKGPVHTRTEARVDIDATVQRMTTREHSLRQEWEHRAHTSLPDNWHYQTPMTLFPHGTPFMPGGSEDMGPLPLVGNLTSFNINEDDMDCPGLGSHHLPATIRAVCGDEDPTTSRSFSQSPYNVCMNFSEGLYEISDEVRGGKVRAMSVDEVPAAHWDDDDDSNNNVVFLLPAPPTVEADNRGRRKSLNSTFSADSQGNRDTLPRTVQTLPTSKRRRRASLDSGVVGGRRVMEETGGMKGSERRAVAEPGTPMEGLTPAGGLTPYEGLTPVASFSSLEQLLADSQYIIGKLQPPLCAERVNQMTRTYNDIEAVAGLLEEKERDLELAARIGQTLLSKNKELSGRKELLEEQLTLASETIKQLKHELCKKVQQLEVYDQDLEESQTTQDDALGAGGGELAFSPGVVEKLQKKVGSLEEENISLRMETAQLLSDTETYEEKEKKLVKKSLRQYAELSEKVEVLTEELQMKKKENSNQKDDINSLVTQLNKVCHRIGQLTEENADLLDKLQAAQESQTQLARELSVQKDKYDELFEFLEKTQEQLRHRHPTPSPPPSSADGGISTESLASELQHSLSLEPSQEEEKEKPTSSLRRSDSWRIFETARAANRAALKARTSSDHIPSSASSCWDVDSLTASIPNSDTESFSDGYNADMDSVCGSTPVEFGRPGIPGSNDLQTALQRLALRQGHHEDDINRATPELRSGMMSPLRIPGTPDTVSSGTSGYSYLGCSNNAQSSSSSANYKMSSKLRIVKPMEGSVTLQQWQRLAQPHLGGLFEQRDGVKVKGERRLDLDQEAYTLSDFEDGEEGVEYACSLTESSRDGLWSPPAITSGNLHASASHPNLPTYLSSSPRSSSSSPKPMASSTPHSQLQSTRQTNSSGARPNNSYTMSLGLAAVLQGRDSSLARALMRTSAPSPRTVVSSSGRDSIAVMPADSVASVSGGAAAASGGRGCHQDASSSTDSGGGLFGKLISSGYSLLWNKSESAAPTVPPSPHSPDCVPGVEGQPATASQVFPRGGSGVLGAISTLRKNGIL